MKFHIEFVYFEGSITCTYRIGEASYIAIVYCGSAPFTVDFLQVNCTASDANIYRA